MRIIFIVIACTAQVLGMLLPTPHQRLPWQTTVRLLPSSHRIVPSQPHQRQRRRRRRPQLFARNNDDDDDDEMDWREMRARLIAQEKADQSSTTDTPASSSASGTGDTSSSSYVYETPLIEQGTILLGGTQMDFGFALRQQFFHKSVMLLLQHDDTFTKGIILNRPSALEVDGWRAWCGHGQVAEGGLFVGEERKMGELEINALHSLTGDEATKVSTRVIKGVSYTSLDDAKDLVSAGLAEKDDFWVCVGYSGWAPGQLQHEVEQRDSWYLASADSGTLLTELLREAKDLPPPGDGAVAVDPGIGTWSNLMKVIGRGEDVVQSLNTFEDRMLEQWVRVHLVPKTKPQTPATPPSEVKVGTVICTTVSPQTGLPADRFLIHDQYLHKAILLVIDDASAPNGKLSAVILNRATSRTFQFNLPGSPQRLVPFTGNIAIGADLWLHYKPAGLEGIKMGDSGISLISTPEVAEAIQTGTGTAKDFLLVRGVVQFGRPELAGMLAGGEMRCIPPGTELSNLWPRVWSLTDNGGDGSTVSDGTGLWWLASQCGGQPTASLSSDLADEALAEWLKFYAGVES